LEDKLRSAFDKIHADNTLKTKTASYLSIEINKRSQAATRPRLRLAALCSVILLFVVISGFSHNLFFTPTAYVDMDINLSLGLAVNRFGRVIETYAYNDDGSAILDKANTRFKKYGEAMRILLDDVISEGYLKEDGLVFVSVQAGDDSLDGMLEWLEQVIAASLAGHHANVETDVFAITSEVRQIALEHHTTPAKYLAILELQTIDPTVSIDDYTGHGIGEIRERTRNQGGRHHTGGDDMQTTDEHGQPAVDSHKTEEHHNKPGGSGNGGHPHDNGSGYHGKKK